MIQLINSLPFPVDSSSLDTLRKDWTRFQDGLVILAEIPDAIRGEFECDAEVMKQDEIDEEEEEEDDDNDDDGKSEYETDSYIKSNVNLDIDSMIPSGKGKLFITASKLYWISESTTSTSGWSIDYKNVLLHAISKPDDSSPRPYIYLQLSCNKIIDSDGQEIRFDGNNSDSYDSEKFVEVNLFVEGVEVADEMFVALSECASLHPCDTDSDTEKDKDDTEIEIDAKRSKIDMERFEDAAEN